MREIGKPGEAVTVPATAYPFKYVRTNKKNLSDLHAAGNGQTRALHGGAYVHYLRRSANQ